MPHSCFVTQVNNKVPVLRYRILWLLGCIQNLISRHAQSLFQLIYSILIDSSSLRNNDISVKLCCIQLLETMVYEPVYNLPNLMQNPLQLILSLYSTADLCQEPESQSQCLTAVSTVINSIMMRGNRIEVSIAKEIILPLLGLWKNSTHESIVLRRDVLTIVNSIFSVITNANIEVLNVIVFPLLDATLDPINQNENSFLIGDALTLWLKLLRFNSTYESSFGLIYNRAQDIIIQGLEHVK